jgi:O-acetylhomoserine (thiol)-lyase
MCWSSGWPRWKAAWRRWRASGHAAQAMAILTLCGAGDHIVSSSRLYGGTYNQFNYTFPRMGIDVTFVDPTDPANFEQAIRPNTKIIYGETLGNPDISVFPFEEVAAIAQAYGIPLMIDNTFATPYLCRPFEWGANIVTHSTTKFLAGHGQAIGGVIVDGGNFDWTSGRFANFTTPDPSYHGLVYADLVGIGLPPFAIKARVQVLRDLGAARRPSTVGTPSGHRNAEPAHGAPLPQRPAPWPNSWKDHPRSTGSSIPASRATRTTNWPRSICPRASAPSWALASRAARGRPAVHRPPQALQPPGQRGRRQEPGHPPGHDDPQPTDREEMATAGVTPDFIRLSVGLEDIEDILWDLDQALSAAKMMKYEL